MLVKINNTDYESLNSVLLKLIISFHSKAKITKHGVLIYGLKGISLEDFIKKISPKFIFDGVRIKDSSTQIEVTKAFNCYYLKIVHFSGSSAFKEFWNIRKLLKKKGIESTLDSDVEQFYCIKAHGEIDSIKKSLVSLVNGEEYPTNFFEDEESTVFVSERKNIIFIYKENDDFIIRVNF